MCHPRPTSLRAAQTMLALLTGAALHAQAGPGPLDNKCNENPPAFGPSGELPFVDHLGVADDTIAPMLTGTPLEPGQTLPTNGTTRKLSPELSKELVLQLKRPFSFIDGSGVVAGTLNEKVYNGTDDKCKNQFQVSVSQGCVARLRIRKFIHPLDIVADFRLDQNGSVPSDFASRSLDGKVFQFHLDGPVCAGMSSRWLLLNTSIDTLTQAKAAQVVSTDGTPSPAMQVHVPYVAP